MPLHLAIDFVKAPQGSRPGGQWSMWGGVVSVCHMQSIRLLIGVRINTLLARSSCVK